MVLEVHYYKYIIRKLQSTRVIAGIMIEMNKLNDDKILFTLKMHSKMNVNATFQSFIHLLLYIFANVISQCELDFGEFWVLEQKNKIFTSIT